MAIYKALAEKESTGASGSGAYCVFNGALGDYISSENHRYAEYDQLFKDLYDLNNEMMICVSLPLAINHKIVANQIIRYKDAFKLPERYIRVPFVLYWRKDETERAILVSDANYIEAKGLYFCLTEPQNEFEGARNEVLAVYLNPENTMDVIDAYRDIDSRKRSIGSMQRHFDNRYLDSVDEMKEKCVELSRQYFEDTINKLKTMDVDLRADVIRDTVARCFIIKKAMYVQYMMDKDMLANRHEGDTRKQRQFAKSYTDEIPIVSYSELWRVKPDQDLHPHECDNLPPRKKADKALAAGEMPAEPAADNADEVRPDLTEPAPATAEETAEPEAVIEEPAAVEAAEAEEEPADSGKPADEPQN